MQEALRAGIERIVYTSSVATFDLRGNGPADETRPLAVEQAIGAYKRSKVMAERLVDEMARPTPSPSSWSILRRRSARVTCGRRPPAAC